MTLLNNQEQQQQQPYNHQSNQRHIPIDKNKRPLIHFINKAINSSRRQSAQPDQLHLRRPVSNKCLLRYSYQEEKPLTHSREQTNSYISHSLQRKCNQTTRRPLAITNTFYYCPKTIAENDENGDDNHMKFDITNRRQMSGNNNFSYDYMKGEEDLSKKSLSNINNTNKSAFQTLIKSNLNERNEYCSSKFLVNST